MSAQEKFPAPTPQEMFEALAVANDPPAPLVHYIGGETFISTVRVLVRRGDKFLTGTRAPGKRAETSGKNEFLGGQIDPLEIELHEGDIIAAIKETALREIDEEARLKIAVHEPELLRLRRVNDVPEDDPRWGQFVAEYYCLADHVDGDPQLSSEHTALGWGEAAEIYGNPSFTDVTDVALERAGMV